MIPNNFIFVTVITITLINWMIRLHDDPNLMIINFTITLMIMMIITIAMIIWVVIFIMMTLITSMIKNSDEECTVRYSWLFNGSPISSCVCSLLLVVRKKDLDKNWAQLVVRVNSLHKSRDKITISYPNERLVAAERIDRWSELETSVVIGLREC